MKASRRTMSVVYHCARLALRGEEIRLAHLDHVRDWILADDLGGAVSALLAREDTDYRVYNGAGPRGYTHRELLDALARIVPLRYRLSRDPADANVPASLTRRRRGPLSIRRLLDETPYRAEADLDVGLRLTVEWAREAGSSFEGLGG